MKKFSEENLDEANIPDLPTAGRSRRGPRTSHRTPAHQPGFEILRNLKSAFSSQPRKAARAERLARKYAPLRHRARGDIGRIMWLINEAGRLEEVTNER